MTIQAPQLNSTQGSAATSFNVFRDRSYRIPYSLLKWLNEKGEVCDCLQRGYTEYNDDGKYRIRLSFSARSAIIRLSDVVLSFPKFISLRQNFLVMHMVKADEI
jgi:hypothetical protein